MVEGWLFQRRSSGWGGQRWRKGRSFALYVRSLFLTAIFVDPAAVAAAFVFILALFLLRLFAGFTAFRLQRPVAPCLVLFCCTGVQGFSQVLWKQWIITQSYVWLQIHLLVSINLDGIFVTKHYLTKSASTFSRKKLFIPFISLFLVPRVFAPIGGVYSAAVASEATSFN